MLQYLFEKGEWFATRRFGYGAGLPIAWQGWALFTSHLLLLAGIAVGLQRQPEWLAVAVVLALLAPLPIYRAKTKGGWKWR